MASEVMQIIQVIVNGFVTMISIIVVGSIVDTLIKKILK